MNYFWIDPEFPEIQQPEEQHYVPRELTDILLQIYCRKNIDGTKHLGLAGNYLIERIGRRIQNSDLPIISTFLAAHPEVVSVELSYNSFTIPQFHHFMESLVQNKCPVKYLGLMNCDLMVYELKALANTVGNTDIEILRINDNNFGDRASKVLDKLLRKATKLRVLDVGNISAHWGLLGTLSASLVYPNVNLQVLDISKIVPNSRVSCENSDYLSELMENIISKCRTLKELHARHNSLDGHDIERLTPAIFRASNLLFVDFAGNNMGDKGAEEFAEILRKRPALIGLNLSANNIKDIGGRALSQSLPFSILRMLDLSLNKIPPIALKEILDTIKKPYRMRILSLWGNTFDSTCSEIVYRMQLSGVLIDECIDIRAIYEDDIYKVVQQTNLSHMHRQRYYLVSVPPLRPMDPYVERQRRMKVDISFVSKLPRPGPCPEVPVKPEFDGELIEQSIVQSTDGAEYTILPKTASPCECRVRKSDQNKS